MSQGGVISATASTPSIPIQFTADSGVAVPALNNLNIFGGAGAHTTASGSTVTVIVDAEAVAYTNVTNAMSPYTVLTTDYYLSVDSSGGAVTLRLPNAPTTTREFIVKDRLGASAANNITVTTVGGAVNIDGATSYVLSNNYEAIELLFNGTTYEIF